MAYQLGGNSAVRSRAVDAYATSWLMAAQSSGRKSTPPRPARPAVSSPPRAATTAAQPSAGQGRVKWFDDTRGFGFISPDDGSADVFVHISALRRAGIGHVHEGQRLRYELAAGNGEGQLQVANPVLVR